MKFEFDLLISRQDTGYTISKVSEENRLIGKLTYDKLIDQWALSLKKDAILWEHDINQLAEFLKFLRLEKGK